MTEYPTRASRRAAREAEERLKAENSKRAAKGVAGTLWSWVREVVIVVGLAVGLSFLVKTFLVQPFHIPSGSMEDTLVTDDRVIVSKLTPSPVALNRGDIVVFSDPDQWLGPLPAPNRTLVHGVLVFVGLAPDDSQEYLIKRVIGLPGDQVACCDESGRLSVNGKPVLETYIKAGDTPGGGRNAFSITVPAGRVWVMGDHRSDSADSRFHDDGTGAKGSIPISAIKGKAVMIAWPIGHLRVLSTPDQVFATVPAAPSGPPTSPAPTTPPALPAPLGGTGKP